MPTYAKLIAVAASFLNLNLAYGLAPCLHKGLGQQATMVHSAAVYRGSGTKRQTVEEYAEDPQHNLTLEQAKAKFAPTGKLKCGGVELTANVVGKQNVLLTANHVFRDWRSCRQRAKPESCQFTVDGGKPVKVKRRISTGDKCPTKDRADGDWAILELESAVDVVPYALPPHGKGAEVMPGKVVAVGNSSADFRRVDSKTGQITYPKHIQDCETKKIIYISNPVMVLSKCDGSVGKSGGALLDPNLERPTILGMTTLVSLSDEEIKYEMRTGQSVEKDYSDQDWSDAGVMITENMYRELKAAIQ